MYDTPYQRELIHTHERLPLLSWGRNLPDFNDTKTSVNKRLFYVLLFNAGERRQLSEDLCGGKDSAFL